MEFVREYLSAQQGKPFSYPHAGATRRNVPAGYTVDHNQLQLGQGPVAFDCATKAVKDWKTFDIPRLELYSPDASIEVGTTVAVLVRHLNF
jgi:uncharacterized protein (UPF0548 family)